MKKLLLIFVLLLSLSFDTPQEDAYTTGEWFKLRIHYGFVNAGYATLEVKDASLNSKKTHHIIGKG